MAHSQATPNTPEWLAETGHTVLSWLNAERWRTFGVTSIGSLLLAFALILAGPGFGLVSLFIVTLAVVGVSAGLVAIATWSTARRDRRPERDTRTSDDSTSPASFLIGFRDSTDG